MTGVTGIIRKYARSHFGCPKRRLIWFRGAHTKKIISILSHFCTPFGDLDFVFSLVSFFGFTNFDHACQMCQAVSCLGRNDSV